MREISTRARIKATGFTNFNEWSGFEGDPVKLMELGLELEYFLQDDSFDATDSITICAITTDKMDAPLFPLPVADEQVIAWRPRRLYI